MKERRTIIAVSILVALASHGFAADPPAQTLPFTISMATTVTSIVKPDGTPDYLAALNQKYGAGVTADNNGFLAWLQVVGDATIAANVRAQSLTLLNSPPVPGQGWQTFSEYLAARGIADPLLSKLQNDFDDCRDHLWAATDNPQAAAYLDAQAANLNAAPSIAGKSKWWYPAVSANGSMINVLIPSLGSFRAYVNALTCRAMLRAGSGDIDGSFQDLLAVKRIGHHLSSGTTLIDQLVGIAINTTTDQAIAAIAASGRLTEAQCRTLEDRLAAIPLFPPISPVIDVDERWTQLDIIIMISRATADQKALLNGAIGDLASLSGIEPDAVDWDLVLRQVNKTMDELVAATSLSSVKAIKAKADPIDVETSQWAQEAKNNHTLARLQNESREDYSRRIFRGLAASFLPGLSKVAEIRLQSLLRDQMAQTLLAAALYKARTGAWPATLADLVPLDLKEIPKDIYPIDNPGELTYTLTPAGPTLSGIGNGRPIALGIPNAALPAAAPAQAAPADLP